MSKVIYISKFLNPHCFYFKFDDDLHDNGLQCLEDKISKYARDRIHQNVDGKLSIAVGDTVAAYVIPWGKWVRSVVRCDLDRLKCYELWAIDHGKTFRTAYKNVVEFPGHLANEDVIGVHRGSLYGVSPAKLEFNLDTCKSEIRSMENWSEKATNQSLELLSNENVTKISFEIKATYGNCYFGNIYIEKASSKTLFNIADALKQIDEAIDIDFEPELDRIEAKYRKFHLIDSMPNKMNDHSDFMNTSSVHKLLHAVQYPNRNADTQSVVQSTIIPSEIDGGATRMRTGLRIAAPSIAPSGAAQSTIVASEINGGETRMQKKTGLKIAPPSEISNGQKPSRPKRNLATNINSNGNNVRRQMPPMPAGHEPDMDNFTKYNS